MVLKSELRYENMAMIRWESFYGNPLRSSPLLLSSSWGWGRRLAPLFGRICSSMKGEENRRRRKGSSCKLDVQGRHNGDEIEKRYSKSRIKIGKWGKLWTLEWNYNGIMSRFPTYFRRALDKRNHLDFPKGEKKYHRRRRKKIFAHG